MILVTSTTTLTHLELREIQYYLSNKTESYAQARQSTNPAC